ncbi:MAG: oxidoreductase [Alphaproteobacteria bacterium PA2]|nr:MAG: oxidoreductase [Alphaproteobacteria bacterium PA2]
MSGIPDGAILVTGSQSGIGAAIASRLVREGRQVIGVDLVASAEAGSGYLQFGADLTDPAQIHALLERLPPIAGLVHAAGFMRTGDIASLDPGDGQSMWAIHVQALVLLAQRLVPAMPRGGRLLAIGSRTSTGAGGKSQYAACKAAVTALIRSWAIELAPSGVTANVIAPAATATGMLVDPKRTLAPVVPPIGRYIEPDEIAALAAFILSPEASAITGQELLICGGASLS